MAVRSCGQPYQPTMKLLRFMERQAPGVTRLTVAEKWSFWHSRPSSFSHESLMIWSGTESVLQALAQNGLHWTGPSASRTTTANDKAHWSHLSCCLPQRKVLFTWAELSAWLDNAAGHSERGTERPFGEGGSGLARVKPRWSWAGRGQRTLSATLSADDERFIGPLLERGAVVEGFIRAACPWAIHGVLGSKGETILGTPRIFKVSESGAPRGISRPVGVRNDEKRALMAVVEEVVSHLASLQWFGPFGVDFLWLDGRCCLMDLNARFTLGWSEGMGEARQKALAMVARDHWGHSK